jgi:hypothetical protein
MLIPSSMMTGIEVAEVFASAQAGQDPPQLKPVSSPFCEPSEHVGGVFASGVGVVGTPCVGVGGVGGGGHPMLHRLHRHAALSEKLNCTHLTGVFAADAKTAGETV